MYLQALEVIGFKSFAQKTRLVFEPGITAIVGPNGCGKSNISDAIRWVLGEQRPTALRSSAMTDVIFNGTDAHKPLGMTEVSITFADCEKQLGTDYNEVTISRRVFRTGEGHYYINKTPCRLRDIQRLFMGTGIGTTSYSVMAQGQIDAILSSKPEDRRAIFEEASGITRFRADRKEAMRKLDQTDANLLRLSDVIRELHRQIGSLQRQAGKARRYKELQSELRKYDLFVTTRKIIRLNEHIASLARDVARLAKSLEDLHAQVETGEALNADAREKLMESERRIGSAMELAMEAQGRCNQAADAMRVNHQRMAEYKAWTERDEKEIAETKAVRAAQEQNMETCETQLKNLESELGKAEEALARTRTEFDVFRNENTSARNELQKLRTESVDSERLHVTLQNELTASENSARDSILKNERLASEKATLSKSVTDLGGRLEELEGETETLTGMVDANGETVSANERKLDKLRASLRESEQARSEIQSQIAVHKARIQLLTDAAKQSGDTPAGIPLLLDKANPLSLPAGAVLGAMAEQFSAPKECRKVLEAVLRAWIDAVAVRSTDDAAAIVAKLLATGKPAGARLMVSDTGEATTTLPSLPFPRLIDKISCKDGFKSAAERLLGNVFIVETLDAIPSPVPSECTFATLAGAVAFPSGLVELWMPEGGASNPLARHLLVEDAEAELAQLEIDRDAADDQTAALRRELDAAVQALQDSRNLLDQSRRSAAQKEGEEKTLRRDLSLAKDRLTSVSKELAALVAATESTSARGKELVERLRNMADSRKRLADAVAAQSETVQDTENNFLDAQGRLTESRLTHASISHRTETLRAQYQAGSARIAELDRMVQSRQNGIKSYEEGIGRLSEENAKLDENLSTLEADVDARKAEVSRLREERASNQTTLEQADRALHALRRSLDQANETQNKTELALAEAKMRLQNIQDRLMIDWHINVEQLVAEPMPDWGEAGEPPVEEAESKASDIRSKMEEMGPVNLVAIEEYQEIEERHAFLTAQEADLTGAKAKLMDLIKDIDKQSTELFKDTFEKASVNFQTMFQRLFDGGTAQLTLIDDENVLECGIEIIARPPGKKPQGISLLSGGERTMTAVALLFAIYMIKPSPFALLDELDAALDDSNIGRFVGVLKDFLDQSQFLIITHNQHTIAGADIVYGVTQQEQGISRIVSMRLKRVGIEEPQAEEMPEIAAPPPPRKRKKKTDESV